MQTDYKPSFLTLLLLISFAAVNAVLYTPALPEISQYFNVSTDLTEQTITLFLVGYALGQLVYGPIANRYGRLPAIYTGAVIQILSSLACAAAAHWYSFELFLIARFMAAIGSAVGLKIVFTLVNEYFPPKIASQKTSYLVLVFAIAPGLSVSIGGILTDYFSWISCFYFLAAYGLLVLFLSTKLPETKKILDLNAFKAKNLIHGYTSQIKIPTLVSSGFLMGGCSSIIYLFASLAPFIAIQHFNMTSSQYGFANLLPALGMFTGGIISAQLVRRLPIFTVISMGLPMTCLGVLMLAIGMYFEWPPLWGLFAPAMLAFAGNSLMYGNTSTLGLQATSDKAHGSSVLNFLNMGLSAIAVLSLSFHIMPSTLVLPLMCGIACLVIAANYCWLLKNR